MASKISIKELSGCPSSKVDGLTPQAITIQPQTTFGESGDVFNHRSWRRLFFALFLLASVKNTLVGLANFIMVRGKQNKILYQGKRLDLTLPILKADREALPESLKDVLPTDDSIDFHLNYATGQSKVQGEAITPERLKCLFRGPMVGYLIDEMNFPAISEATGYGDMARSFKKAWTVLSMPAKDQEAASPDSKKQFEIWEKTFGANAFKEIVSLEAIVAGCFSSKEVYLEDEQMFPGCIAWTGIHAMMVDARNHLIAASLTDDKKRALENSNFYGDFKRKTNSRGLSLYTGTNFINFLKHMQTIIPKFLKISNNLTAEEAAVIKFIKDQSESAVKEPNPPSAAPCEIDDDIPITYTPFRCQPGKTAVESLFEHYKKIETAAKPTDLA